MNNKSSSRRDINTPPTQQRVYTDFAALFMKYEKQGESIIYLRDGFYPVIRADVLVKEKSREQMGDIEKTILGLINIGLTSSESVALAMGMAIHRLSPILQELGGRSLIRIEGQNLTLRELGSLSLDYGAEVVEVPRSFLLSGLDGSFLPRGMYSAERVTISKLPELARFGELLDPARRISLAALEMSGIEDRYQLNIPHEALSVSALTSHEPLFVRGKLIVSVTWQDSYKARFISGATELIVDDEKMIVDLMEPLGFSSQGKSPEMILDEIVSELTGPGSLRVGRAQLDHFGNPEVVVHDLNPTFEAIKINGLPLLAHLGTRERRGAPIQRFPFAGKDGSDKLRGRTMTLIAGDNATQERANKLRLAIDGIDQYYRLPKVERPTSFAGYLQPFIASKGWNLEEIKQVGKLVDYHRLINLLSPKDEN